MNVKFNTTSFHNTDKGKDYLRRKNIADAKVKAYAPFTFSKASDYENLLKEYQNRDEFQYDIDSDALYNQYKDMYINQGRLAMEDSMAKAASLTGGYGNSYAQSVGQQTYQQYMDLLNQVGLDLEKTAYDRYQQEGQDMLTSLGLLENERTKERELWQDEYQKLLNEQALANDDYYKQLSAYYTERDAGNSLLQQEWQNNFNQTQQEWQNKQNSLQANQIKPFVGKTYEDAMSYLQGLGVNEKVLSDGSEKIDRLMSESEWNELSASGNADDDSYEEYVKGYVEYAFSTLVSPYLRSE